jgi:hypothetical protein
MSEEKNVEIDEELELLKKQEVLYEIDCEEKYSTDVGENNLNEKEGKQYK